MGCLFSKKNEILLDLDNHNTYNQYYFGDALDDASSAGSFGEYSVKPLSYYMN